MKEHASLDSAQRPAATGDMDPEAFRRYGHQVVDWMADYLAEVGKYPVLAHIAPGDIRRSLPGQPPIQPEAMETILADFDQLLMPGITHWNSPGFMAYFGITGSGPGILGEMLSAALNVNAMLWRTSPAYTLRFSSCPRGYPRSTHPPGGFVGPGGCATTALLCLAGGTLLG